MKTLQGDNTQSSEWNNRLITDLAYIKQHLRYRIHKGNIYKFAGFSVVIALLARMSWMLWLIDRSKLFANPIMWLLIIILIFILVFPVISYLQVLKFKSIPTSFFSTENQEIIKQFLTSQHLALSRLNEAPEVFQIISGNLSAGKKEIREVMIFIADDKRILVNSHYTGKNVGFSYPSTHYKKMIKLLTKFANTYNTKSNGSIMPMNR